LEPIPVDILVVDDRPENLLAMRAILGDEAGYRLHEAKDGSQALKEILKRDYCVVLLDAVLPGMDGFEIASLIKQRERSKDVPIIFLTASGTEVATVFQAYKVGAVDYLVKPVAAEVVRAKVAVFVDLFRKTKLLQQIERREQALQLADLRTASERRYRNLAEAIPQIVWRALPDGSVEYRNSRWFDYTGAGPGPDAWTLVHPEDREKSIAIWEACLRDSAPLQCEARLLRKDGVYRWHLRRALPEHGPDGEVISWLGTDTDIDDRKREDDERVELLVRERAARFEAEAAQKRAGQLYVEAREAVQLRDEFLTVAAHELRTPLTSLRLQAQVQARDTAGNPQRIMARQVERLCRLVDQLLDVSRISSGRLQMQVAGADLRAVAQEVAMRLADEARANGCTISLLQGDPLVIDCDSSRMEQVITNLLSNAIKYGRGKPIEIAIDGDASHARLSVRDHGIGISLADQGRIFERFERAVSVREYGGLGIGLYISKQIVLAHGGTIRIASELGAGALFEVELPIVRPKEEQSLR
jgi:PAS domain S-box-containing protein